ncbi:MAG TPA: hypothetical protein VFL27_15635 [Candidatus Dormibacteraeota bacterium]|nr:hypothetical protein [Candidatus Dormibacteraeota bacterium]
MSELPPPPPGESAPAPTPNAAPVTVDSAGRRWYWDGTQWRPAVAAAPARRRPTRLLAGVTGLIVLGVIYFLTSGHGSTQKISNAKIDSATQLEFDYHASSDCSNLTFSYTFYDSSGKQVDVWNGETSHSVQSGHDYHITASADPSSGQAIDSSASRFQVAPTCHTQ